MSKVTVLMAVYNAEKYLHKSLNSLMAQTLKDIQVVCIDDCSKDSSLEILNSYASKDKRVKVMHLKKNHGQAYARNIGLTIADGEFITMLDADDWLAPDALELVVRVFERHPKTDCVLMDLQYYREPVGDIDGYDWHYDTVKTKPLEDGSFDVMTGYDAFIASLDWGIHGVTMDRRSLYEKFPYDASCRFYSDDNTVRLHYLASREVRCCKGRYYYRQVPTSVSHHIGVGRMEWMKAADSFRNKLETLKLDTEVLSIWEWERWKIIIGCFWFYFLNRRQFSYSERLVSLGRIKRAWDGTKKERLKNRSIYKFGWYPFYGHWRLFFTEENIYFFLRYLLGRR